MLKSRPNTWIQDSGCPGRGARLFLLLIKKHTVPVKLPVTLCMNLLPVISPQGQNSRYKCVCVCVCGGGGGGGDVRKFRVTNLALGIL